MMPIAYFVKTTNRGAYVTCNADNTVIDTEAAWASWRGKELQDMLDTLRRTCGAAKAIRVRSIFSRIHDGNAETLNGH